LDNNYLPIAYTDPFTFENQPTEYTLGLSIDKNILHFGYSMNERDSSLAELDLDFIFKKLNFLDEESFYRNISA
jgi:hypothetical protein